MRLAGVVLAAALPTAFAAQQRILMQATSIKVEDAPSLMAATPVLVNSTEITQAPKPLTTAAAEKPALEASVMGLIVFSAAGLYLL
ncbi:hypothetical protein F4820DRAFT_23320 [Hypoxylon rubiginosum]|uniref:Uncharacterized protein n=1 Tax=Hypoxylon rubiginosum TaxID=110542 RepID=A0ACB9YTG9_9PEZI|nr:hypothetical protein F4820DRAFT_23320 [Hypoxylon rubiginosum]